jgi:uncharacterized membrane protein YhaH (DUF805 family)
MVPAVSSAFAPSSSSGSPRPGRLRAEAEEVVAEAVGRGHRHDPVLPGTGGPAGNARLTAWTGLVLLVLFVAELVTLLDVRGLISWHVALGVLLIPPALLKTASTGWRILRYYTGSRPYREAGPPPLFLRILGPLVVAATLALLGTGIVLIALGEQRSRSSGLFGVGWVELHQAMFVVFAIVAGLHLLARLVPALALTTRRVRTRVGLPEQVSGGGRRLALVVAALAVAGLATALLLPLASDWQGGEHGGPPGFSGHP